MAGQSGAVERCIDRGRNEKADKTSIVAQEITNVRFTFDVITMNRLTGTVVVWGAVFRSRRAGGA